MTADIADLQKRAEAAGLQLRHSDAFGKTIEVSKQTLRHVLNALGTAFPPPPETPARRARPRRGFTMADLGHDRLFGLSVQLYGLRSRRNWGIGDFTDLATLAAIMADQGAAAIGVNPLHALFPAEPGHCSPYSPSSRQFLNPLYIDPEAAPGWEAVRSEVMGRGKGAFAGDLERARAAELIDYPLVASLKRQALLATFGAFEKSDHPEHATFDAFVERGGENLEHFAIFEALHEHALAGGLGWSWRDWSEGLGDPSSEAVLRFADQHTERIRFSQYLQWLADRQLALAQERALAAGMPIGIYRDLAVAVDPSGAAAWSHQGAVVSGVTVGAPPDQFNPLGQNWGLAPFSPAGLHADANNPLRADIEANMRHAGALRIDHVMGLMRLFWIPEGAPPEAGAYMRYPLDRLLAMIGAASRERRCLMIGEDLGTVAPGFRRRMSAVGLMSYRLLYFERQASGALTPPSRYPRNALVSVSTHDLPTLQGFWQARDLDWRDRLGLHPSEAARDAARLDRERDKEVLRRAFDKAGMALGSAPEPDDLTLAAHRYLAATPSRLMMVQIEDVLGEVEQANLPGTIDEHPNWRRRLPVMIEDFSRQPMLRRVAEIMKASGRNIGGPRIDG